MTDNRLETALRDLMAAYAACNGEDHPAYERAEKLLAGKFVSFPAPHEHMKPAGFARKSNVKALREGMEGSIFIYHDDADDRVALYEHPPAPQSKTMDDILRDQMDRPRLKPAVVKAVCQHCERVTVVPSETIRAAIQPPQERTNPIAWLRYQADGEPVMTAIPRVSELWIEQGCVVVPLYERPAPHHPRTDLDILIDRLRVKVPASSQFQPLMDEAADAIEALRSNQPIRTRKEVMPNDQGNTCGPQLDIRPGDLAGPVGTNPSNQKE